MISYVFCFSKNFTLKPILPFLTKSVENCNRNYILFTKLPWSGDSEGTFRSASQAATCMPHMAEASHCPFNCCTSSREAVNTNFYSVWFDPTGNRTRVYRFSSKRSIHSTTDRFTKTKAKIQRNYLGLLLSYTSN